MHGLVRIRRALISVSDKRDLIPFAKALVAHGVEIVSTGGTSAALAAAGIPVVPIEKLTGFPEMMDGRVKTLHPRVHGGLLGRRDVAEHVKAMEEHGIAPIDLVCVNLYPFEMTVRREGVQEHEAIEQIDIGGPSMLRSAAKNHEFVTVVTDPAQYDAVASELAKNEGATTLDLRRRLAAATFARTAAYDTAISAWIAARAGNRFPPVFELRGVNEGELRYGENPHQAAAVYRDPTYRGPNVVGAELLHGKPLSYNNLLDAAAALELVQDLRELAPDMAGAVVVKHTNPCGTAIAPSLREAFARAYAGDPLAAFGGIVALNAAVDKATAEEIVAGEKFLEVVVAPSYEPEALALLQARWKNARLLAVGPVTAAPKSVLVRSIAGGFLAQEADTHEIDAGKFQHVAGPAPSAETLRDAAFLTAVVKHLKSNAVCIGKSGQLLGAGAGQMDRVASCRNAVEKSGSRVREGAGVAVAASDAFFPFDDGPRLLIEAGVRCLVHPGGSKRDEDTFKLCNEKGVTCLAPPFRILLGAMADKPVLDHPSLPIIKEAFPNVKFMAAEFRGLTTLVCPPERMHDVLRQLRDDPRLDYNFLTDVTAVDYLKYPVKQPGRFAVIYLLHSHKHECRLAVKCFLNPTLDTSGIEADPALEIDSACDLWPGAEWTEREVYDMYGIRFRNHPDLRRILLWKDFPGHPLRKDYPLRGRGEREHHVPITRESR